MPRPIFACFCCRWAIFRRLLNERLEGITDWLAWESLWGIMIKFIAQMPQEFRFLNDDLRYRGRQSKEKVIDFFRIFEFRPDEARALLCVLKREDYSAAKLFEEAVEAAELEDNFW